MAIDGQALDAPDAGDDLIAFLEADDGSADAPIEPIDGDEPGDEPDNSDLETAEDDPAEDDAEDDESEADPDAPAKPATGLKFKVPIKGEDGADTTIEVDEKELISGYQRHSDYTRKTQELAQQRDEVQTTAMQKIDEGRNFFLQQAQLAHDTVSRLAGLKTPAEMAQLAQTNPSEWAAETARTQQINAVLQELNQASQRASQQREQEQGEVQRKAFSTAWGVLGQHGIDKPKLTKIFEDIATHYGVDKNRFATVTDPKVVLIMQDAAAYRALKAKAGAVTKKVAAAPRLPAQRQAAAPQERTNKRLEDKFRTGNAGLRDLARFV
ncbi:hypothetical protein [Variovorax sp. PAMC 28711]|uniref:hypothetical protein n=1 Tax=Variovorax sp. PAMC 28711 TaxID=1795631 RepID=UPI00078E41F9|nr:hypothetical protein [Variovorax sp. PAMC 28711]AMM22995.1 hypothetical protein AX767_00320 [Variovorax sp. PAMC 28711]